MRALSSPGKSCSGGLLGVPVVGSWLLGTPVVGLSGGAVVGSSLGSLHVCDSRGALAASVYVVVGMECWAGHVGRGAWLQTAAAWPVAAAQRGAALIPRPVGLDGAEERSRRPPSRSWWLRVWQCFHTRVFHVLQLSSVLVWPYSCSAGEQALAFLRS